MNLRKKKHSKRYSAIQAAVNIDDLVFNNVATILMSLFSTSPKTRHNKFDMTGFTRCKCEFGFKAHKLSLLFDRDIDDADFFVCSRPIICIDFTILQDIFQQIDLSFMTC